MLNGLTLRILTFTALAVLAVPLHAADSAPSRVLGSHWRLYSHGERLGYVRAAIDSNSYFCSFAPEELSCKIGLGRLDPSNAEKLVQVVTTAFEKEKYGSVPAVLVLQLAPLILSGERSEADFDEVMDGWIDPQSASKPIATPAGSPRSTSDSDYGNPSEMKGLKKIYLDTGTASDLHNLLASHLTKRIPSLQVVGIDDAELILVLSYERSGRFWVGQLNLARFSGTQLRKLQTYRHEEEDLDDFITEIGDMFIKEFRKINGLK